MCVGRKESGWNQGWSRGIINSNGSRGDKCEIGKEDTHGGQTQWDGENVQRMRGVPWEPAPGREGVEIRLKVTMPIVRRDIPLP